VAAMMSRWWIRALWASRHNDGLMEWTFELLVWFLLRPCCCLLLPDFLRLPTYVIYLLLWTCQHSCQSINGRLSSPYICETFSWGCDEKPIFALDVQSAYYWAGNTEKLPRVCMVARLIPGPDSTGSPVW
jgi:hypothetical protein